MKRKLRRPPLGVAVAVGYVAAVLLIDAVGLQALILPPRWLNIHGADLFKLAAWFLIPFLCCIPRMDWAYFKFNRWRPIDYALLGGLLAAGLIAVIAIPLFPRLHQAIPMAGAASISSKAAFFFRHIVWTLSWLLGWEFMHRYLLLRRLRAHWPRFGWLLVPVFETAYHLTWWPMWPMPAAMLAFSLVATPWALKRRNTLLPFLAHLAVELELGMFQLLAG